MNASFRISVPLDVVFFLPICQADQPSIAEGWLHQRGGLPPRACVQEEVSLSFHKTYLAIAKEGQ
jgi:hypothetical protein